RLAEAERLGATTLDASATEDVVAAVRELTGGGSSYAIDTTAVPAVVKQGLQGLRSRGTLVALGLGADEYPGDAPDLLQGGKRLMSSLEGDSDPREMVPRMIDMRAAGTLDLDPLVTTYPFSEINTAVADVLAGKVVKPVLVW
ncbi:MAG: zinc-binding dehydrogenase, partial [Actinomycetota bacterium]|nr:zinc-binding dehydrogenase [Actinomycetota bacterium]